MSILSTDILVSNQTNPLKTGGGLPSTAMAVPGRNATSAGSNQLIIAAAGGVSTQALLAGVAGTGSFSVGNVTMAAAVANTSRLYDISPATGEVFPYKTDADGTIRLTARDYFVKLNVTSTEDLAALASAGKFTATVAGPTSATAGSLLQISRSTRNEASCAWTGGTSQTNAANPANLTVTFIDRNLTMATPA